MRFLKTGLILLGFSQLPLAATFTQAPALSETGGKATITFTVSNPVDVEVGIVDRNGKVVRHLAAGVVGGPTAPPEPLDSSLAQSLEWDGLDDYGNVLYSGPFTARVRLGVTPQFDRKISVRVFPTNWGITYGSDTVESTSDLIPMTHPIWRNGMGHYQYPDTMKDGTRYPWTFRFYAATTRLDMCVSDETDEIVIQGWNTGRAYLTRLNGLTGAVIAPWPTYVTFGVPVGGACASTMTYFGEPAMDWFGRYVFHDEGSGCNYIYRFNLAGQPVNYPNGKHIVNQVAHTGGDYRQRGMCIGPDGMIYHGHYCPVADTATSKGLMHVSKYDSNGNAVNEGMVKICANIGQGIRVDLKGNIFMGARIKPYNQAVPPSIRAKLQGDSLDRRSQWYWADEVYGSLFKFGPEGGTIVPDAAGALMGASGYRGRATSSGVKWSWYGMSFQATHSSFRGVGCYCYTPRFDVDRFGRVIFTNPFENEFICMDNNGAMIYRIHNRDLVNQIKIGSAHIAEATDKGLYLGDHTNNQIVRFNWAAEAEVSLPIPTATVERLISPAQVLSVSNEPNPFTPSTRITVKSFQPSEARNAKLAIYDATGKKVADLSSILASGKTAADWNGKGQPTGIYYLRLSVAGKTVTRTMMLMK